MKRRETAFFRALGEIPESYIDELTQFQADHAKTSGTDRSGTGGVPDPRSTQKERLHMKHTVTDTADKNREAGISVKKLRPVTAAIFASLAACAVIGIGFGTGFISKDGIGRKPADSPEPCLASEGEEQNSEADPAYISTELTDENGSETHTDYVETELGEEQLFDDENRVYNIYSCFGDNTETGGIPEIPENGALLFTSMDELCPILERATNTDFPVKGVDAARSCFESGRNVLLIKVKWVMDSYDEVLRSMYVTADGVLHADVAYYTNDNTDSGLPDFLTHSYLLVSVPGSLTQISGSAVQRTLYVSDAASEDVQDPLRDERNKYFDDGVYLQHLDYLDADYIFPETSFELYTSETFDADTISFLGNQLDTKTFLPDRLHSFATEIAEPNLTQLNENCIIVLNDVQHFREPYIAVFENPEQDQAPRRLVFPNLKYQGTVQSGTRMTILCSSALSANATNTKIDWNGPLREETALPHNMYSSAWAIVNNPDQNDAADGIVSPANSWTPQP